MAIPDFQLTILPSLQGLADGAEHHVKDIRAIVAKKFNVSAEEQLIPIPSGGAKLFANRVAWGLAYLKMAELVESSKRSYYQITKMGKKILEKPPETISVRWLKDNTPFDTKKGSEPDREESTHSETEVIEKSTPDELIASGYRRIRQELKNEILQMVKSASPSFFERLVIDLLMEMGYGTDDDESGIVTGKSGDGGIDGLIKQDKLGLERIYVQAKKWENPVGREEIQKFAGALQGRRAKKGVFITTSIFSQPASDYANAIETRIVLIDGDMLTDLMIDHNVGVSVKDTYTTKRIDSDYFSEE